MLRLYLVRHGWTAWHSEMRVAGWANVPLNRRGRSEAQAAGAWLCDRCSPRPLALISSPVVRAHQTAQIIAQAFSPPLELRIEPGVAETRIPEWQGRLVADITTNDHRWPAFYQGPADFRFPGGETGREVQARAVAAVETLRQRHSHGDVILVSHADPLRGIIAHYLQLDAGLYYRLGIECGSISRLSLPNLDEGHRPMARIQLDLLNLTEHLPNGRALPVEDEYDAKDADHD